jgi:hypothetical protein
MKLRKLVGISSSDTARAAEINVDFTIQNSHTFTLSDKSSYTKNENAIVCAGGLLTLILCYLQELSTFKNSYVDFIVCALVLFFF